MEDQTRTSARSHSVDPSPGMQKQLQTVASFYENMKGRGSLGRGYLSVIVRYLSRLIPASASVFEVGCGNGDLLSRLPNKDVSGIDLSINQVNKARQQIPDADFQVGAGESYSIGRTYDVILLSDVLNEAGDVQMILQNLHSGSDNNTRLVINFHNTVWRPVLQVANFLGLRTKPPRNNWLSRQDVANLLHVAGWEVVRQESRVLVPHPLFGLGTLANALLSPFLSWICLVLFVVARKSPSGGENGGESQADRPAVSVLVPARNEAGNIDEIVARIPDMGKWTEILFIEGNSSDGTWDRIQEVIANNPQRRISALRQSGKGKGDAMRLGYKAAKGDIFIILDADMTVAPEDLPKFYNALADGKGEFINGVRLVYPLEEESMRFLNMCGNKFFSLLFSWLLGQAVKDTLCGTKAFSSRHYRLIEENRSYFGDFDPFGDFDLLFGAAHCSLRIVDIPVRYHERTYGEPQIDRWRDGALLFRMAGFAARKIKFT